MSADRPITRQDIAVLLASALGQDKSDEVVATAARAAGIMRSAYVADDIRSIFDRLVKAEGLVGVVARFAVSRGDVERLIARVPKQVSAPQVGRPDFGAAAQAQSPQSVAPAVAIDIMHLIVPALGTEKAREAIEQAAARRGVDIATGLSYNGALAVLDEMTKVEGIVGVVARFAKARFLLNPYS
ncbi:MAG: hypothetical protein JWO86_2864 [Myxococcaceae bacterium]|jgi:hypothetical protein|nr:hypothetical protein [Myxococcaceae bacterium]